MSAALENVQRFVEAWAKYDGEPPINSIAISVKSEPTPMPITLGDLREVVRMASEGVR